MEEGIIASGVSPKAEDEDWVDRDTTWNLKGWGRVVTRSNEPVKKKLQNCGRVKEKLFWQKLEIRSHPAIVDE